MSTLVDSALFIARLSSSDIISHKAGGDNFFPCVACVIPPLSSGTFRHEMCMSYNRLVFLISYVGENIPALSSYPNSTQTNGKHMSGVNF